MKAETTPRKYRIGSIKGMGSMRKEFIRFAACVTAHLGLTLDSDDIKRATATEDGIRLKLRSVSAGGLAAPWTFNADGTITPGTVSYGTTIMPTMGGTRLDAATPPTISAIGHTGSGTEYYYLKLTWGTTFTNNYLSAMTLAQGDVIVERYTAVPSSTSSVKYIHLATFVDGTQTAALVTASPLPVTLWDNGYLATVLRVGQL